MIIVEGPDGSGKTNLISRLTAEVPGLFLHPRHADSNGPTTDLGKWVSAQVSNPPGEHVIFDRHALISEPIYGPIIRGRPIAPFDAADWYTYNWRQLMSSKPLIIYCLPPISVVKSNLGENRVQMKGVKEQLSAIYWAYNFALITQASSYSTIYHWDYTHTQASPKYSFLKEVIRERMGI